VTTDSIDARFLSLQRDRFRELMKNKEELHRFILELQQSVYLLHGSAAWEFFRQSGAWDRLKEYASAEDQFKFNKEWNELVRLTFSHR